MTHPSFDRRQFLATAVGAAITGMAGCSGGGEITEAGKKPFESNPVSEGVDERPKLGQPRSETDITIVNFTDPSCPPCSTFHDNAFQKIRSNWVDEGKATVFVRLYPFVADWADAAGHALAEVQQRNPAEYWSLSSSYYEAQEQLVRENIAEKTRQFLADSDVDADAVAEAAIQEDNHGYLDADDDAVQAAGVYGVPTNFLFENGEFVTTLMDENFGAFKSAVGDGIL